MRTEVPAGRVLSRQGERDGCICLVEAGRVDLVAVSETGRGCVLDIVCAGGILGERALLDAGPKPFGAIAVERCALLTAPISDVEAVLHRDARVARALFDVACRRSERFAEFLRDASMLDAAERIVARLSDLGARYGVPEREGVRIELSLTQEDLARMAGCTRETVNRAMASLLAERRVRVRERQYLLPHPPSREP
ncbi:MAG: Crp/Fnr family transcriptional regulator [Actinomycetota bacterium]|nr:Crp/Fnr family transcriptional regulator [Actinomycetota bacterium]